MEKYFVRKTTLSEYNRGICGSPNNARYTGATPCWEVVEDDAESIDGLSHAAYSRKQDALLVCDFANKHWDGRGDITLAFINKHYKLGYRPDLDKFKEV